MLSDLIKDIRLCNVLLVPDIKFNLLSIPKQIHEQKCWVSFTDQGCYVQNLVTQTMNKIMGSYSAKLGYLTTNLILPMDTKQKLGSSKAPLLPDPLPIDAW